MGDPVSALSNVLFTVGTLLYEEAIYLGSVAEKLKRLRTELVWMKCFLKDAAAKRLEQEVVKAWVAEVRENAYEAEDTIDAFDMEIKCSRRSSFVGRSCSNFKQASQLHEMGNRIDVLVAKISDLNRRAQTYGIIPHGRETSAPPHRETFLDDQAIERDDLVGFDTYVKNLKSILLDKERNGTYNIVTISGMGGLGKTTLARKVYHDEEIRMHFSCSAWVSISKQFQTREIWQIILSQLESPEDGKEIRALPIMERLRQLLRRKRCLLVVDDLWENEDWDSLKQAFGEIGSTIKILITSRNQGVATTTNNGSCNI